MENLAASTITPEERTLLERLDRLPALQREKLYDLFREKRITDRNNPEYLRKIWETDPRWKGIERRYSPEQVLALRAEIGSDGYAVARERAEILSELLSTEPYVHALSSMTGNQAVQQVTGGLKVIYLSGWQVAADANLAHDMFPDQSLYPWPSVPAVAMAINNALRRAYWLDPRPHCEKRQWLAPIVADAEAGFGGHPNAFVLMQQMIAAGIAGVHFEDQLASAKKCGHLGGKVLVPTGEFITKLQAARLAADIADAPTILLARTDADSASFLTSDIDERDHRFIQNAKKTQESFYHIRGGLDMAIARGLSYAPYADMLWCETSHPDLGEAREFAGAIHAEFPGKLLAYNCSPSFNWKKNLDDATIERFQDELGKMGYQFQFVTLAGFHSLNASMFELASGYHREGMPAYVRLQEREFELEREGYGAVKHQKFVGTGYFDKIMETVTQGQSSLGALKGSTEEAQFASKNT